MSVWSAKHGRLSLKPSEVANGVGEMNGLDTESVRARAAVARGLLCSITAWPWEVVKVEESDFPCIPHPHFDFYHEVTEMEMVEERPGFVRGKVDAASPRRQVNIGCYLGKECDADFIQVAPAFIRQQRDDLVALLARVDELEAALREWKLRAEEQTHFDVPVEYRGAGRRSAYNAAYRSAWRGEAYADCYHRSDCRRAWDEGFTAGLDAFHAALASPTRAPGEEQEQK